VVAAESDQGHLLAGTSERPIEHVTLPHGRRRQHGITTETTPDDVARTIRFLCDEEQSDALTGAVIEIHSNL
jgi:NAD(P)-dependent dehydrogenase (short-subunit alcohol dehydrogenase family)